MVIGPLDKNLGECWVCCPVLYEQALQKAYTESAGYKKVEFRKATAYQIKKYGKDKLHQYVIHSQGDAKRQQRGTIKDAVKAMRLWYYDKELNKMAKFDGKGNFNVPYVLFKAKNFVNPDTRAEKWQKARPIAPATAHPMRDLMGRVGRAWYFAVNQARDDQFDLIGVRDVPQFLKEGTDMFGRTEDELVVETMEA